MKFCKELSKYKIYSAIPLIRVLLIVAGPDFKFNAAGPDSDPRAEVSRAVPDVLSVHDQMTGTVQGLGSVCG